MRWIKRIEPRKGFLALGLTLLLAFVLVFALGWRIIILYGLVMVPHWFISEVEPAWSDWAWYASMCCCAGPTCLGLLGMAWSLLYALMAGLEKWFLSRQA